MTRPVVLIFHRPATESESPLVRLLAQARERLVDGQAAMFRAAGADVQVVGVRRLQHTFGEALAERAPRGRGVVVLSSGGVARLTARDAAALVAVAAGGGRRALTNNRYSSDVCAISDAEVLRDLPPLPGDNALPRWLEETAGFVVDEMGDRERLALDLDSPLDVALAAAAPSAAGWMRDMAGAESLAIPRRDELRDLAADARRELLVFGRAGSSTLAWLERNVRCRIRFLAEERGLRAATRLASPDGAGGSAARPPRSTLGALLDHRGPAALAAIVADLADGALIDSRVLLAHRFGGDEEDWPPPSDRFASDLLRANDIGNAWLRELTASAERSERPILLGGHSLVGPGARIVLAA